MKNWIKAISVVLGIIGFLVGLTLLIAYYPVAWTVFVIALVTGILCIVVVQLKREFDIKDNWRKQ